MYSGLFNNYRQRFKQIICLILVFSLAGCKSAYNLNLYTQPSGATVQVGSKVRGETPCKIKIPKDSALIKDNHIDISYFLPEGRRMTKTYDLRDYEPPDELPYYIAGLFIVPGLLLLFLTHTSEDDRYSSFDKEDSNEDDREIGFIGLGLVGLGVLVFQVLGGDTKGIEGYDILETFDDANDVTID
jgi:hypothetical protein